MIFRVLADITMTVHFLFLAYVALGGFLAWRWPRTWFAHAAAAIYGLVIEVFNFVCVLTPLEDHWRRRAGQEGLEPTGFIDTYIEGVVYPEEHTLLIQWLVGVVVVLSWLGLLIRLRRRRAQAARSRREHPLPDD
ncbi:DUF2784 domain-containing protein [Glycomyces sp. L485]|uniref:DUF2784 domain-containing protein n=1 Tax=Glycomyces sp. L485 TaxID=2909235 RepID=UPI001F4A2E4B|nr:DUF2784 domain-containing protein [Glycomyces sp. L485]MCH7230703.1 DUF2784 domain-containing protein [Glycomyces sp. L485]